MVVVVVVTRVIIVVGAATEDTAGNPRPDAATSRGRRGAGASPGLVLRARLCVGGGPIPPGTMSDTSSSSCHFGSGDIRIRRDDSRTAEPFVGGRP